MLHHPAMHASTLSLLSRRSAAGLRAAGVLLFATISLFCITRSLAGIGLLIVGCLLALGFMQPGRAPLPILVLICALITIAESGNYVATSRGYMLRMRPRLRHACNAVWSACTQIFGGIAAILVGFWLQSGRAIAFRTAAWGLALLMLAAIGVALYLPVPRADSARGASPVYDPARPFRSLALILRYVLRPARTRINLENGTDGSRG